MMIDTTQKNQMIVFGAGRRVREDLIPVMQGLHDSYVVRNIFAKNAKTLSVGGETYTVRSADTFSGGDLKDINSVYIAVPAMATRAVVEMLSLHDCTLITLFVDTPTPDLSEFQSRFKDIVVAEDSVLIPWISIVQDMFAARSDGSGVRVFAQRSLFRFHGTALLKALFGVAPRGGIRFLGHSFLFLGKGIRAHIIEPRDYSHGRLKITIGQRCISDRVDTGCTHLRLLVDGTRCVGFAADAHTHMLTEEESKVIGDVAPEDTIITKMLEIKRVGLMRLLSKALVGTNVWPYSNGRDDIFIDERLNTRGYFFR